MNRSAAFLVLFAALTTYAVVAKQPRARFCDTVTYHSAGRLTYATGSKDRDRTITLVPVDRDGLVATLDVTIVDHVEDDFEYHGVLNVDEQGNVSTRQKEMVNAANILVVTPQVMKALREGQASASTTGHVEVSQDLYDVTCTHRLVSKPGELPLRVRTETKSADGKIDLYTDAAFGSDDMPLSARTQGTIKAVVTVSVDLSLTRLANPKKLADGQ